MTYCLAPLAEFTDAPFRKLCAEAGADMAYTEMVSAAALFHGHQPTRHLMEVLPGESPIVCQIFGAEEDEIAFATRVASELKAADGVSLRFCGINLNAGCPMPRIVRTGAGARLVADPEKVHRLIKVMVSNTSLPVTLKTRLGPHAGDNRIFELADAAELAGAKGLVVHARYTNQMHGGPTNLDVLAEVVRRTKLPVTGNGGIKTVEDAEAMAETGVVSVMVARTAMKDPAIFSRLKGMSAPFSTGAEWAIRHMDLLHEFYCRLKRNFPDDSLPDEDEFIALKARTHLFRYFNGMPHAATLRGELNTAKSTDDVMRTIRRFLLYYCP